ncbi:MAG: hypothetical protein LBK23_04630 [Oscillospiraceae bacterium]|jgi:molybdenum-dependent DNA-binding transcriptional regulator ModE|nr:hypothetical protein [Oscillospiraceae bacterium]
MKKLTADEIMASYERDGCVKDYAEARGIPYGEAWAALREVAEIMAKKSAEGEQTQ